MIENKSEQESIVQPKVLIVTTRSGKGTFFQLAPLLLPKWQVYNADLKGISTIINGVEVKLPFESLGDNFTMPIIVVTHYHVFLKMNKGIPQLDDKGYPLVDKDEHIIFKPLTQADYLQEIKWDFVWCDEVHRMKERKNKWVKNIKKLKREHSHASTGTGFINRPQEIWSILQFLGYKDLSYWQFVEYFCTQEITDSGYAKVVGINEERRDEFRALVRSFGPRRELSEVMKHLKEPMNIRKNVQLSPTQRKMYNEIERGLETMDRNGVLLNAATVLSALQRLRQICVATPEVIEDYYDERQEKRIIKIKLVEPSSKLDALMEVIEELQWDDDAKEQIVVFSNFKDPLYLLEKRFKNADIPYIHMQASDNDAERFKKWSVDWPKKEHQVFLSTVSLGGESINLTSAERLCFLDRSWSPKDNAQAIGRIHRPGQEGQPIIINIEAENTTDQYVEETNIRKNNWFKQIFHNNYEPEPVDDEEVDD